MTNIRAKMKTYGERLAWAMRRADLDQSELARRVGIKQPSIAHLLSPEAKKSGHTPVIARVLRIDAEWLATGRGSPELKHTLPSIEGSVGLSTTREPIIKVPLISWVQASRYVEAYDPYERGDSEGEVEVPYGKDTLVALRVKGSSMNRVAPEGSIIIVDYSDKTLTSGKYYVVKQDAKATFKRYRANPDRFEPDSTETHDTIFPEGPVEVVGRVVKVINDL
jgi:phage repressor protein C with HTH and peptisase S24 domain